MATNQEKRNVEESREKRDYADGKWRGYESPYFPEEREKVVLANIYKVSPEFVRGYKVGRLKFDRELWQPDELD